MKAQLCRQLLQRIEQELRQAGLWSQQAPSAQALASTAPFCCDSMPFEHWLQFVFLARMHALLDGGLALPSQICICPMAEEALKNHGSQVEALINRIADLDELLSGRRVQTIARDTSRA